VKHSSSVMSRTMSKLVLPSSLRLFQRGRRIEAGLIAYFILMIAVALTTGYIHIALFVATLGLTIWTLYMFDEELQPVVRSVNYDNLGIFRADGRQISFFISTIMFVSLLAILLVAFFFQYMWWSSAVIIVGYLVTMFAVMRKYSKRFKTSISIRPKKRHKDVWNFDSAEPAVQRLSSDEAGIAELKIPGMSAQMPGDRGAKAKGKWKYL